MHLDPTACKFGLCFSSLGPVCYLLSRVQVKIFWIAVLKRGRAMSPSSTYGPGVDPYNRIWYSIVWHIMIWNIIVWYNIVW